MTLLDRILFRGTRTLGLLEPGERIDSPVPVIPDDGLRALAEELGLPYHDESLIVDALFARDLSRLG